MLQQTRVDSVISYYTRWVEAFPTIDALAEAGLHDVLKLWEGLGYYSRARNLHSAARLVREQHSGRLPDTYELLRALPGIGDYTAGAVASIAYKRPTPAVDGNVRRVLSRLFDVAAPTVASVRRRAEELVDPQRPGDFNQALMELGATVCTPRAPSCSGCPVNASCLAQKRGTISLRPGRKLKKPIPHEIVNSMVLVHADHVLLSRRPDRGLLGGLYEFPEFSAEEAANSSFIGKVTHTFSHKRIEYRVYTSTAFREPNASEQWVQIKELSSYPLPKAQRKIEMLARNLLCVEKTEASAQR